MSHRVSIAGLLKGRGDSGFGYDSTADEVTHGLDLSAQTILVTGCNSGLGKETMRVLCARGARVIGAARTIAKATSVCDRIPQGRALGVACDLSEFASVRTAVTRVRQMGYTLDAIVANAGIMAPPHLEKKRGYELQFLTNHVGHHFLVTRLVDRLSDTGRVVMLSSGQTANAVHPGVIKTNLQRHLGCVVRTAYSIFGPLFFKSIPQGAATQCYVAVHPAVSSIRGEFFSDCNIARSSSRAQDAPLAAKLWNRTEEIITSLR